MNENKWKTNLLIAEAFQWVLRSSLGLQIWNQNLYNV
jgi:hypothetical protein